MCKMELGDVGAAKIVMSYFNLVCQILVVVFSEIFRELPKFAGVSISFCG